MKSRLSFSLFLTTLLSPSLFAFMEIIDARLEQDAPHQYSLSIAARGDGIEVRSYEFRLDGATVEGLAGAPGIANRGNNFYLESRDPDSRGIWHFDNGVLDEDDRPGHYRLRVDTSAWPNGIYDIYAVASNRPAPSTESYLWAYRPFRIRIGDTNEDPPVSTAHNARHSVVFYDSEIYASFPNLYPTLDGHIAATFEAKLSLNHADSSGGEKTVVSEDFGETWRLTDGHVANRRFLAGDRLLNPTTEGWVQKPVSMREELRQAGRNVRDLGGGRVAYIGDAIVRTSTDRGESWETTVLPRPDGAAGLMLYLEACAHLVTTEGVRMTAIYGRRTMPDAAPGNEVFFIRSDNDGESWEIIPMFPNGIPSEDLAGMNETAIVETDDGRILAMMRRQPVANDGYLYRSHSDDQGLTWITPEKTDIWGYPAHLLRLPDGRILCTYGYRQRPTGVRATISSDNGETWDVANEIVLRNDGFGYARDLGYPISMLRPDGSILTVYYFTSEEHPHTHIAATIWELAE
jgi:hypothetical protein